ncbi:carboxylic ester hydrolase [Elysia marginata]|uniref:Carboxylic ester hydrolase n=1 Tax=Elysia marginata TaxID=1093978 RepID=A0AAV4ERX2_9GAST|nr:carboxylic ester hydrolase [Elysia marginata]
MQCLRNKSVEDIRDTEDFMANHSSSLLGALLDTINPWGPVIDGQFVKSSALDAMLQFSDEMASDKNKIKSLMIGITTDEASMFYKQIVKYKNMGKLYLVILSSITGTSLNVLADLYPVKDTKDISGDIATVITDFMFRCPLRILQRRLVAPHEETATSNSREPPTIKFWPYLWHAPMVGDVPADLEYCRGKACHGAELPFLFRSSEKSVRQPNRRQMILSNAFVDYVANFVATGDPNIDRRQSNQTNSAGSSSHAQITERQGNVEPSDGVQKRSRDITCASCVIDKSDRNNFRRLKRREIGILNTLANALVKKISHELLPENNHRRLNVIDATNSLHRQNVEPRQRRRQNVEPRQRRRQNVAEHLPYWNPVTATSGYETEPTWLFNELNFLKNSKIKMAKQDVVKGRQCDLWDKTEYKFPKLFGS